MKFKKLLVLVSMLAVMFSLTGCDGDMEKPFDYDDTQIVLDTMKLFQDYSQVSEEFTSYYISAGDAFEQSAVKGIEQVQSTDKVGEFEDFTPYLTSANFNPKDVEYKIVNAKDSVSVSVINEASNRDVEITVKYVENAEYYMQYDLLSQEIDVELMEATIIEYYGDVESFLAMTEFTTVEELVEAEIELQLNSSGVFKYIPEEMVCTGVYSKGELIKQAGMNTLIGMGTVFIVLIFISFIISLFKYLPALFAKKPEIKVEEKKTAPVVATTPAVKEENLMDDSELVAVITAAITAASASCGNAISKDKLVVRSIKRVRK